MHSRCIPAHSRHTWDIQTGFELAWHFDSHRMGLECVECCWNAVRIFRKQSEAVSIHFQCRSIFLHFECTPTVLSMKKTFLPVTRIHTTAISQPFFRDHPGELVPEENFWTLWCKGRLTEADTPTIPLGATLLSRLTSAHLHHPPVTRMCPNIWNAHRNF